MTWYASEVLAKCNEALLAAVMNEPRIAAHAYLIQEPIPYEINGTQSVFHPPEGGLLVIRPICDPETHCASWHNSEVLSWHSLSGPSDVTVLLPQSLGKHVDQERLDEFPPVAFLSYLKKLAMVSNADLVFFHCFMWGGDTEFEYSWSFGRREQVSLVLEPGVTSKVARSCSTSIELLDLDLLSDALAYLGAPIPSPFCILHTGGFPWERFKVVPAGLVTNEANQNYK